MAIKKGFDHYFCDNCGAHVSHAGNARPPKFCTVCLGKPGGAHLNDDTLKFLKDSIYDLLKHARRGDAAYIEASDLKLKLAALFLEKITAWEDNIHSLPDGPSKNSTCKELLTQLDKMAREIHPVLIYKAKKD